MAMALNHSWRTRSVNVESSNFSESITEEAFAMKSAKNTAICFYQMNIAGHWRNTTVTWSRSLMNHTLTLSVEGLDGLSHSVCRIDLKPWYLWSRKGYKSFDVEGNLVHVYWDLTSAKILGGPEPNTDYYVAIVCNEEAVLLLGDLHQKAYKKTKSKPAMAYATFFYKKERVFGKKNFSTKARFDGSEREHDIIVGCSTSGHKDPEMWISIDGIVVIHVQNLQWKFRGNEMVLVNKQPVQVFWDVHDWFFSKPGSRHGSFVFRPGSPELDSKGSSSYGDCSSISNDSYNSSDSTYYSTLSMPNAPEFCLFLSAWKID